MPTRDVDVEHPTRGVQVSGDVQRGVTVQFRVVVPGQHGRVPGDQMRVGVLVGPARAGQVGHQPARSVAAGHVRHHDAAIPSSAASTRSAVRRTASNVAAVSGWASPVALVALAIWLTLLLIAANSR